MSDKKKFKKFIDKIKKMTPDEIKIFERFKEWGDKLVKKKEVK